MPFRQISRKFPLNGARVAGMVTRSLMSHRFKRQKNATFTPHSLPFCLENTFLLILINKAP